MGEKAGEQVDLSWEDVYDLALDASAKIKIWLGEGERHGMVKAFPVPRGGIFAAMAIKSRFHLTMVDSPEDADIIIDDLIDSGLTRDRYVDQYRKPFFVLIDKPYEDLTSFINFPWEVAANDQGPLDNVRRILQYIGEDQNREGLIETPARVVKTLDHLYSGYKQDPKDVMKVFEDGGEDYDEMVLLKDIEFFSTCEHHMQPFFGKAHIAYIPNKKVLGISKLARLLEVFARRLQIQERLTSQVADALMEHLQPLGVAVVIEAKHFCMIARGVQKQNSVMTTSVLRGAFKDDATARAEFISMIQDQSR